MKKIVYLILGSALSWSVSVSASPGDPLRNAQDQIKKDQLLQPASQIGQQPRVGELDGLSDGTMVYVPAGWEKQPHHDVILFLHGVGESGTDHRKPLDGGIYKAIAHHPERFPALVIFPQCPKGKSWSDKADQALASLSEAVKKYRGDESRIHLVGLSMGGYGVWQLAMSHPGKFASLTPISSGALKAPTDPQYSFMAIRRGSLSENEFYAKLTRAVGNTPTWVANGDGDTLVYPSEMQQLADRFRFQGISSFKFHLEQGKHGIWDKVFADKGWADWLFSQGR